MPRFPAFRPSVSHASLGGAFFDKVAAAEFPKHVLRFRNSRAAASVGLDTLTDAEWIEHFGRFSNRSQRQRKIASFCLSQCNLPNFT